VINVPRSGIRSNEEFDFPTTYSSKRDVAWNICQSLSIFHPRFPLFSQPHGATRRSALAHFTADRDLEELCHKGSRVPDAEFLFLNCCQLGYRRQVTSSAIQSTQRYSHPKKAPKIFSPPNLFCAPAYSSCVPSAPNERCCRFALTPAHTQRLVTILVLIHHYVSVSTNSDRRSIPRRLYVLSFTELPTHLAPLSRLFSIYLSSFPAKLCNLQL